MNLRDRMDADTSKLQKSLLESTPNKDLRQRLKDLSTSLKQGRVGGFKYVIVTYSNSLEN